jgi:PAS domain S-box-containing protein/diguanylate cyclase (GGDEF)-like protein
LGNDKEIFQAVLDVLDVGLCIVDRERTILYWNTAAERTTGYLRTEVLGRTSREDLVVEGDAGGGHQYRMASPLQETLDDGVGRQPKMYLRHKQGHRVPVHLRTAALRDANGHVVAGVEWFTEEKSLEDSLGPAERSMARPDREHPEMVRSKMYMEALLQRSLEALAQEKRPFGVLLVKADQWEGLRKTHGQDAASSMLRVVEETLLYTLGPSDALGLWDEGEFLVVMPEATARGLELDADLLRGMVASAQFRWWGDRMPLTVSLGGLLVAEGRSLRHIMERARAAMEQSAGQGGNAVTVVEMNGSEEIAHAEGNTPCLP